ncbi:hypothetical protein GCM10027297_01270 [Parahaliea aestuarii]
MPALLIALCAAAASTLLSLPRLAPLPLSDYQSFACSTPDPAGKPTLQLLSLTDAYAEDLASLSCQGRTVAERFAGAEIRWRPRSFLSARDILEGRYDLFWNRRHLVEGMVPEFFEYYQALLQTPNYPLYWLSNGAAPAMSQQYLEGRVVGLLADTTSQTYYQRPMNALNRAGLQLGRDQLRLFPDPQALYRAFATGEVDLISSPLFVVDGFGLPYEHHLLIDNNVPSGTWYVRKSLVGSGVDCDLLAALEATSALFPAGGRVADGIHCP